MRKENRVVITYLNSLEAGIKEAKEKISKCKPHEISDIFNELQSKVDDTKADKIESFIYSLGKKNGNR